MSNSSFTRYKKVYPFINGLVFLTPFQAFRKKEEVFVLDPLAYRGCVKLLCYSSDTNKESGVTKDYTTGLRIAFCFQTGYSVPIEIQRGEASKA